jgi:predicted amidohydrolase YtcJ
MVLVNGEVITMSESSPRAEAIAIRDGKIVAVGQSDAIMKPVTNMTRVTDLRNRTVVPGFFDSHCHPLAWRERHGAEGDGWVDLSGAGSVNAIVNKISEVASGLPSGRWIRGNGYLDWRLEDNRQPTRWDLDKATKEHFVAIIPCGGHVDVVNSKVLKAAGITRESTAPSGGQILKDSSGEPNGILLDTAAKLYQRLLPRASDDVVKQRLREEFGRLVRFGVTSYMDAGFAFEASLSPRVRLYQEAYSSGGQRVRAYISLVVLGRIRPKDDRLLDQIAMEEPVEELLLPLTGFGNDWLKIGPIKIVSDGAEDSRTAGMFEPYEGEPENRGNLVYDQETLNKLVSKLHRAGYQLAIHACGDKANDMVVTALSKALKEYPRPNPRHRIEHAAILSEEILDKWPQGVIASVNYSFIYQLGDGVAASIGKRSDYYCCGRSFVKRGIRIAGGSDYPMEMFMDDDAKVPVASPLAEICYAVTRRTRDGRTSGKKEALTVEEAIRAHTLDAAYAEFAETTKGSIEPGKLADLVVLSDNPSKVPPEQIKKIKVDMTIVGGRIVYERNS